MKVAVHVTDPVCAAGLRDYIDQSPELIRVTGAAEDTAEVRVVAVESSTGRTLALIQEYGTENIPLILIGDLPETDLIAALETGLVAILPVAAANPESLARTVVAVLAREAVLPPHMVGQLVRQMRRLQQDVLVPNGLSSSGLTTREIDVLRLLAEGFDTNEIAVRLNYAERTIKNIVSMITTHLNLRNRTHAVSYALRNGLI